MVNTDSGNGFWDWNLYVGIVPLQAIKSFIYSAVILFVMVSFIVTIFNPPGLCLLKGNKVPSPCVYCDHTTGGQCPKNLPVAWGVSHMKDHDLLC